MAPSPVLGLVLLLSKVENVNRGLSPIISSIDLKGTDPLISFILKNPKCM